MNNVTDIVDREIASRGGAAFVLDSARAPAGCRDWIATLHDWVAPTEDAKPRPVRYVWQGLIPCGLTGTVVAAGGTGKTTLAIGLFVCGALGKDFLGLPVQRGTYVLLSDDDSQEDLDQALVRIEDAMGLSETERVEVRRRVRLHGLQGLGGCKTFTQVVDGVAQPTDMPAYVIEALNGIADVRLIIFDTLRQFSGNLSTDERAMKITIDGGRAIAAALGCAVAFTHHTGKANYRDKITDMYCGTGSAVIADNSRFVLLLHGTTWIDVESNMRRTGQERGTPLALESTRGSLLAKPSLPVYLCRQDFRLQRIAGEVLDRDQRLDHRDRQILAAVRLGATSKNAVYNRIGGNRSGVLGAVDDLLTRGLLRDDNADGSEVGSKKHPKLVITARGSRFLEEA